MSSKKNLVFKGIRSNIDEIFKFYLDDYTLSSQGSSSPSLLAKLLFKLFTPEEDEDLTAIKFYLTLLEESPIDLNSTNEELYSVIKPKSFIVKEFDELIKNYSKFFKLNEVCHILNFFNDPSFVKTLKIIYNEFGLEYTIDFERLCNQINNKLSQEKGSRGFNYSEKINENFYSSYIKVLKETSDFTSIDSNTLTLLDGPFTKIRVPHLKLFYKLHVNNSTIEVKRKFSNLINYNSISGELEDNYIVLESIFDELFLQQLYAKYGATNPIIMEIIEDLILYYSSFFSSNSNRGYKAMERHEADGAIALVKKLLIENTYDGEMPMVFFVELYK